MVGVDRKSNARKGEDVTGFDRWVRLSISSAVSPRRSTKEGGRLPLQEATKSTSIRPSEQQAADNEVKGEDSPFKSAGNSIDCFRSIYFSLNEGRGKTSAPWLQALRMVRGHRRTVETVAQRRKRSRQDSPFKSCRSALSRAVPVAYAQLNGRGKTPPSRPEPATASGRGANQSLNEGRGKTLVVPSRRRASALMRSMQRCRAARSTTGRGKTPPSRPVAPDSGWWVRRGSC